MDRVDLDLGLTRAVIAECRAQGLLRNETAYVLATAWWESGHTMEPVREGFYLGEPKATRYRKRLRYYPHYGRGLVQLTWHYNYHRAEKELGVPLTTDLDLALRPDVAVKVLVTGMREGWFTGKKLSDFIDLHKSHFTDARVIINGHDHDTDISEIALQYDSALHALDWS